MRNPADNNPYTGVHNPSPYSPEPLQPSEGLPRSARRGGIKYPTNFDDVRCFLTHDGETVVPHHSHHADGSIIPTVWTDDDVIRRDPEENSLMVPLHKLTTEIMYDTSVTTADRVYPPGRMNAADSGRITPSEYTWADESAREDFRGVAGRRPEDFSLLTRTPEHLPRTPEEARAALFATDDTAERGYASSWRTPTAQAFDFDFAEPEEARPAIEVREISLEVPLPHDKLYDMLFAVDATIDNRRANGVTIPEESRTVTTIGNEIVIRWEEHS